MREISVLSLLTILFFTTNVFGTELYSCTAGGGINNQGAIIKTDADGNNFTLVYSFSSATGMNPKGDLVFASNNKLYGMTRNGGTDGLGVVFEYDIINDIYTVRHHFLGSEGALPEGGMIEASNEKLYGLTLGGAGYGVLFEYDYINDIYSNLHTFNNSTDGGNPYGNLLEASDGNLYGMTTGGGGNSNGTIFKYNIGTSTFTKVFDFVDETTGVAPNGSLIEVAPGILYGLTGPDMNFGPSIGAIFEYDFSNDIYTKKMDFTTGTGGTGHSPYASLMKASNGKLYGTTYSGGLNNSGVIFEYDYNLDIYNIVTDLDGSNTGNLPMGNLMQSTNGELYGLISRGGQNGEGTIYEYSLTNSTFTKKLDFNSSLTGSYPDYATFIKVCFSAMPGTDTRTECDSYTWIDGITYTSSNNTATYNMVGGSVNGCDSLVTLDLTINSSPTYITSPTSVSCYGGNDGIADVTAIGNGPFTFQWNTGQTTEDLIGVSGGNYNLTITDANGCNTSLSVNVNEPNPIDMTITGVNATCGQYDGSASVTVNSGGTAPFNYTWTNGSNVSTADSLASGTYTVQVVDANSCNASASVSLSDSDGPSIASSSIIDASCVGDNDGEIDVTITGGATPYTFDWSEGSSAEDLSGIMAGSYDLLVTDANGCEASASYTVLNPNPIDLSNVTITEATCAGSDGEATVNPTGGTGNYTYQWGAAAGSVTTATASGLAAGVYNIFVSDDNGCVSSGLATVNNIGAPSIMENVIIQPSCTGVQSGSIDVSVSGGVAPYIYSWSNGATTQDLTGLSPDTLELTVTDAIGCVGTYVGIVNGLTPLTESICMVTFDTITETNLIVWEKTDTVGISHYNIYREGNSTGSYNLVGTSPVNQLSQWVDPTADPQLRSWRYKISAVDSCSNESQLSASHKTMHVTANLGLGGTINCSWDFYDGFTYGSYYISRYHSSTGWEELDTIPSSLTSWTDASPPGLGGLQYSVSIVPPSTCTSTKAQDHNTTRSNRANITGPGSDVSIVENGVSLFTVYPNPSNGMFTINLDTAPTQQWSYKVLDLRGKLIASKTESGTTSLVNISNLESGIYLVEVSVNGAIRNVKVAIRN